MAILNFDAGMIDRMAYELHPHSNVLSETEVCPWTLLLTMAMTLMKGVLPHYNMILPFITDDPTVRQEVENILSSPEFDTNMEKFFIEDIKVGKYKQRSYSIRGCENLQGPINEKLVKSSKLANQIVSSGGNIIEALSAMRQKNLDGDVETNEIESRQHTPSMIEELN